MQLQFGVAELIYSDHANERMAQRGISKRATDLAYCFGTAVEVDQIEVRHEIDCDAVERLFDAIGNEAFEYFGLVCVIKEANVVATVYWKDRTSRSE